MIYNLLYFGFKRYKLEYNKPNSKKTCDEHFSFKILSFKMSLKSIYFQKESKSVPDSFQNIDLKFRLQSNYIHVTLGK